MLWSILILTAINTFWLFYVAGDIPGTVGRREGPAKRSSGRGATGGSSIPKSPENGSQEP